MRRNGRRLIAGLTLTAFLIVDGSAIARTLPRQCPCKTCQLAASNAGSATVKDGVPCCERCSRDRETASLNCGSSLVPSIVAQPGCPCSNEESPRESCPCPGCAYCCVGKVPCVTPVSILVIATLPESWRSLERSNCYSSPFCGKQTPPPRV
jgi:hypothetical protein